MYGTQQERFPQTGAQKVCVHNKLLFERRRRLADVCFALIKVGVSVRKEIFGREVRRLWERGSRVLFGCSQNLDIKIYYQPHMVQFYITASFFIFFFLTDSFTKQNSLHLCTYLFSLLFLNFLTKRCNSVLFALAIWYL